MALQPILGYPSDYRAPFTAVEINFGQGPSTSSGPGRAVHYCGPKTSAGSATVNTTYKITREQDAVDLFGVGSFLHRMLRLHLLADKGAKLYATCYAASSGSGVATATGTITLTFPSGSNPTANGRMFTTICGEDFETSFRTSDTLTTIGDALVAQINQRSFLPVTASNAAGTITLTSKHAGASSGDGTTGVIRFRSSTEAGKNLNVATSGAALGLGTGTPGAEGATTETANLTAALATLTATRYYYMGFSVWTSAAIAPIKTHVVNKSEPNPGLRSRAFTAYTGTQSALTTIVNACNYERRHFVLQEASEHDAAELVANAIAIHRKKESVRGGFVPDNYRGTDWLIKPVYDAADRPTDTEINDACVDGITIIASDDVGSRMVMSLNSRSKNAAGTVDDFRATETHRVSFMDDFADTWQARDAATYQEFKLTADRYLSDGVTVDANFKPPPRTVTPSRYRSWFLAIVDEFELAGVLQNAPAWAESTRVNIDPLNQSRIEAGASGRTMDIRHQVTLRLAETSPG
jgi:phage tail sheath gpL-like